jgi:hypothetical protein
MTYLESPLLGISADILDDIERTRIANENRLRQLTRTAADTDGEERGFGLDKSHPAVHDLTQLVAALLAAEKVATRNLERVMRGHLLGPWVKAQRGVGDKQAARLLAVIGDPYWNTLHNRPRTVSELWAYCGLHTLPVGQTLGDTHSSPADEGTTPASGDHGCSDTHALTVAARRAKGQRANWSSSAKSRAWGIAGSMLKAGNREVYDKRRNATDGHTHAHLCVRCGPKGKPAQPSSPWSAAHQHADALRIVSKDVLRLLWLESKRLHAAR